MDSTKKTDYAHFSIDIMNINSFNKKIAEVIHDIKESYPEVDTDNIRISFDTPQHEDDLFTYVKLTFVRNKTKEELESENYQKNLIKQRAVQSMRKLVKDNFSDMVDYLDELGFDVKKRNSHIMKIDCADSIKEMFKDEL